MDNEIYLLIKKRNEKGMILLINEYSPLVKAIVKKHLYNLPHYHEECINDVYLAIWNNILKFDEEKNILKNWIAAIAKYKAIDYKRKYIKTLEEVNIYDLEIQSDFILEKEVMNNELEDELEEILSNLSLMDRQLFVKLFVKEESVHEISKQFNLKPSAIYNRISRGKSKLRKLFLR